jgi:hypothetical protein
LIAAKEAMAKATANRAEKAAQLSQSDFPSAPLSEALRLPRALLDNYAGDSAAPHDLAMAIELSPTSSKWRMLAGCALAYGLTTASFSAERIGLSDLGKRTVAPTVEGDDQAATLEALLRPRIQREFFQRYDKNKFPKEDIANSEFLETEWPIAWRSSLRMEESLVSSEILRRDLL